MQHESTHAGTHACIHSHACMHAHVHTHTHTHTHTHKHTVIYQGMGTEEKSFKKKKVFKEDLKELTERQTDRQKQGVGSR